MTLLQLPPEILIEIFDYVGSSYFRSDLSRLTVCKQWSSFAYPACFREFYALQRTLRRLRSSPDKKKSLLLIKDHMEILDLSLTGFENWEPVPMPDNYPPVVINMSNWDGAHGRLQRLLWTSELRIDLLDIAAIVKQSQKLRILRIQATSEHCPGFPFLDRRDYLRLSTILDFLSPNNLTSLELDLCGTRLKPYPLHRNGEGPHICVTIAALLTTLRRLRLRMRSVCADVLKPSQHYANLRLNEVLINLSLSRELPMVTSVAHTTPCNFSPGDFLQMKADMEEQAKLLVAQMSAPKMVRILTHELPSLKIVAFDVLAGRNIRLDDDAEWDDEGEIIEDETSDEESEISSLSSDNDE